MKHLLQILLLLLLFGAGIFAQSNRFEVYSVEEGLPQSQVYALLTDHYNRLWLGTKGGGLSSFDGEQFTTYNQKNGLPDDKIFALYQDKKNNLWIGTGKGLYLFDGLGFKKEDLLKDQVLVVADVLEDNQSVIWLATNVGLFFKEADQWVSYSELHDILHIDLSTLFLDGEGSLWCGSDDGLFRIKKDGYDRISSKQGLTSTKVRSINEVNGHLLVGTYGGGLNVRINGIWYVLGNNKEIINDVFVDSENEVWLATHNNGIVNIQPESNEIRYYTTADGLSTNHTRIICQDAWGNIWIGTSGGGLNKMYTPIFKTYNKKDGFDGNMFYTVLAGKDSSIWTSTNSDGIARIKGDSITIYNQKSGFKDVKCKALFEDSKGVLWIGTEGSGVYYYYGSEFYNIDGEDGLADNWIREITQDANGNIWVATVSGISKITYEVNDIFAPFQLTIKDFSMHSGLPDDRVNCIKVDAKNRVWFGCQSGHVGFILDDNAYASESDHAIIKNPVKSMDFDQEGRIWLATEGNGIFHARLDQQFISFVRISVPEGLNNNNVYLIKVDQKNHVWAGAGSGVDELALNDNDEILFVKHYAKNEGFLGGETCSNAAAVDWQGRVWIGTLDGLNCYTSKKEFKNTVVPRIFMEGISVFYEDISQTGYADAISAWYELSNPLQLTYLDNHLSFHFNAINLLNPDKVYFHYLLEGFDTEWSPIDDRKDATYSNLPSGEYTFRVKGVNEDGVWSEELQVKIHVETPYWETWWFRLLIIGGISLFALGLILLLLVRIRKKNKEEKEKLRVERNLLELEQKALRLQMNPHFIFNAMNTVQALIAKNDTKEARYYLAKFSKLMRKILENSRHALISIQDEIDALENYLNLEKISGAAAFDYEIVVDDQLASDAYGIPPLILQPFAENAIVHGIKDLDYTGLITISFKKCENFIECAVKDNGRGRKMAQEVRHQKSSYHKSTALVLTQERLAMLSTNKDYKAFEIVDLEDPTGTLIIVRIPIVEIY